MDMTTIQINKTLLKSLKEIRDYPRQTYNELIEKMIHVFKNVKKNNQYDEFLHKIQQAKMKELWDNKAGDVVLANIQFTDTFEIKKRPALVLFEEFDNVVVAGITSNLEMKGISLTKREGAIKESVIKLNYIFTVSKLMIEKRLFSLSNEKKKEVYEELVNKLKALKS